MQPEPTFRQLEPTSRLEAERGIMAHGQIASHPDHGTPGFERRTGLWVLREDVYIGDVPARSTTKPASRSSCDSSSESRRSIFVFCSDVRVALGKNLSTAS